MTIIDSYAWFSEHQEYVLEHLKSSEPEATKFPEVPIDKGVNKLPVWQFRYQDHEIHSSKAVSVKFTYTEGYVCAENDTLGILAVGESRAEAIEAFGEQLIHYYNHYKNLEKTQVTGEAEKAKELYMNLFHETAV